MPTTIYNLIIALPLLFAHKDAMHLDDLQDNFGGASWRCFESAPPPADEAFKGSRLCRGGDHSWLLMTARIPGKPEYGPKILSFLKFNTWLSYTWLVEIDSKGKLVGPARNILEPVAHDYDVSDLGAVCLGCCFHDGKIICLNPEGTIVEVPTQDAKSKSTVTSRLVNSLDPDKLAAEFCADSLHVAFQALRADAAGNPEVYLEIERKSGQRLFVRRSFKWDELLHGELLHGDYHKRTATLPVYHYLGQVNADRKWSAVYDQSANELLFVTPAPFKVVKRATLMEKQHSDDLNKEIAREKLEMQELSKRLKEFNESAKEPIQTDYSLELSHYGKISLFEVYRLGLPGLFQLAEIGDNLYGLYVEMRGGKVILRPYEDGKTGKSVPIPSPRRAQTIDYQTAVAGKQLFAFTVEKERDPKLTHRWGYITSWFFRTYQFDGTAWKQLPTGANPLPRKKMVRLLIMTIPRRAT